MAVEQPSLFGLPGLGQAPLRAGAFAIIGMPTEYGNGIARGTASGPSAIRAASGLEPRLAGRGTDLGNVPLEHCFDQSTSLHALKAALAPVLDADAIPVLLGGDHSISHVPLSLCARKEETALVWFDAHTDFSEWEGPDPHDHKQVLRRIAGTEGLRPILQIGYRGITVGDERACHERVEVLTTAEARQHGPAALMRRLPADRPVYLSIDIDVLDPCVAPGTTAPVPSGLLPQELSALLCAAAAGRRLAGVDLVEVNPRRDRAGETSAIAASLLRDLLLASEAALPELFHDPDRRGISPVA